MPAQKDGGITGLQVGGQPKKSPGLLLAAFENSDRSLRGLHAAGFETLLHCKPHAEAPQKLGMKGNWYGLQ